jgi:hypothetical protein
LELTVSVSLSYAVFDCYAVESDEGRGKQGQGQGQGKKKTQSSERVNKRVAKAVNTLCT